MQYFKRFLLLLATLLVAILPTRYSFAQSDWQKNILGLINESRFAEATAALEQMTDLSEEEQLQKEWYLELMRRIRIEFPFTEEQIKEKLADAGFENSDEKLRYWESKRYLEMRPIDGERRYFKVAVGNLPRLDPELRDKRVESDADRIKREMRLQNCAEIVYASESFGALSKGRKNVFTCIARIPANTIPEGKTVRYWAPFPRESCQRQRDVKLVYADGDVWRLSPATDLQRTLYMEKKAVRDQDVVFKFSFETTSYAQYFAQDVLIDAVKPYDKTSEIYKTYTAEYLPHMIKTDSIEKWAKEIVGDETNPVKMVSLLFDKIDEAYPWASSNEYGTMPCIPEYVMREGHGDCGMLTLLLISACRSVGIPAKWQSGWVMYENSNLCGMHDWGEVYYEGVGWVPVDMSYGLMPSDDPIVHNFYKSSLDQYRLVINDSIGRPFFIPKKYFRSEPVDLQKGEIEWDDGNLYFDKWSFRITVELK
ncbi:MAG: transglutaminase-like domain-containing protein [Thermoguttaceae bacterium]